MRGLPDLLRSHLREEGRWIPKNQLTTHAWSYTDGSGRTYGADLVSRKLRNLEEASVIAVKYVNGHSWYKYVPDYLRDLYVPASQRTGELLWALWTDEKEVRRRLGLYDIINVAQC